jgi:membrane associated rhomboid family serine protease
MYTTRPLRSTLFASTALFIISLTSGSTAPLSTNWLIFAACAIYAGLLILLYTKYYKNKMNAPIMAVNSGILTIPRVFRKPHRIPFHEIKSLEKFIVSNGDSFAVIGMFNKPPIFVAKNGFFKASDFDAFTDLVAQCALKNQSVEYSQCVASLAARSSIKSQSTITIIALTWLVSYALVCNSGLHEISVSALTHGALTKNSVKLDELYRIASSFFLHLGPLHLGLNVLTFAIVSRSIEIILGRVRLINILVLSAVSGALLSWAFSNSTSVVGASGGILGLIGAHFVLCVRYPRSLPGSVSTSRRSISIVLFLQLCADITIPGIDAFSHLGGLILGMGYACFIARNRSAVDFNSATAAEFRVAITSSCLYIAGLAYFLALYFDVY